MNIAVTEDRMLDYAPCRYGPSRLLFRGPQRALEGEYIACIGGTETFGRFMPAPYPALLEQATGTVCVNLGSRESGIDAFVSCHGLPAIAGGAAATVIQVLGATNMSNRYYTVDPRRNHHFIRATRKLKEIYPEVDFREFDQTSHLLTALARVSPERLQIVRRELQTAWVARMRALVRKIGGRVVLLWLADHPPYARATGGTICREPLFVDRAMLRAVCEAGPQLVEVVVSAEEIEAGLREMVFAPRDYPAAAEMLGPVAHRRAAQALAAVLGKG